MDILGVVGRVLAPVWPMLHPEGQDLARVV
mgnify:FL=1